MKQGPKFSTIREDPIDSEDSDLESPRHELRKPANQKPIISSNFSDDIME